MTCEVRFGIDELRRYAAALLTAGGFRPAEAGQTADVLVWANARAVDSHGVLRIPRYVEMVELGLINPAAEIVVEQRQGAITRMDAARAPGATAMIAAMREAVGQAKEAGVSWCAVRNITHAGAVGYYASQAAREGRIGIVMTASGPLMAYHGSRSPAVSTNPIAIAVPSENDPIVLDMSTANVALGKVMAARDAGQSIPADWGMDAEGHPTTDPGKVETLTPLGGPKGSGLSLMIEILTSVLVGNPVIAPALEKSGSGTMNGLAIAVQVDAFGALDHFRAEVERLAAALKGVPRATDTAKILMPGERGFATAAARETEGIPLPAGTVTRLAKLAEKLGVSPPQPRAGP